MAFVPINTPFGKENYNKVRLSINYFLDLSDGCEIRLSTSNFHLNYNEGKANVELFYNFNNFEESIKDLENFISVLQNSLTKMKAERERLDKL